MSESQFRTKTGTCTVTDDRLLIERSGPRGALAAALVGNSVRRILAIYGLIAFVFGAYATWLAYLGQWPVAILLFCLVGLLVFRIVRSRGISATPEVLLASIERIEAHPPREGVTRGYFLVHFLDQGKPRKRTIILPGILENGADEFQRGREILRQRGLLETTSDS